MLPPQPTVSLEAFLNAPGPILDVRSPAEYEQGRIPGAASLPLFSNEERARVGTCYKQVSPYAAFELGLELVQPRLERYVERAQELCGENPEVRVHCWRGGMRSQSMAHLLRSHGLHPVVLEGGYKTFRRYCLDLLERPLNIRIVGGLTGSGKTRILKALEVSGQQVLDLERLAEHRGSAFGALGFAEQPSCEQFENRIAMQLRRFDLNHTIWVEDESRSVGRCRIPQDLYNQMVESPLLLVERPREERVEILRAEYGRFQGQLETLRVLTQQIEKRLGGQRARQALQLLESGELEAFGLLLLDYYDKAYLHSIQRKNQPLERVEGFGLADSEWAERLLSHSISLA